MDLQPAEKSACEIAEHAARDASRRVHRALVPADEDILEELGRRLGRLHAKQRIGIEDDNEARVFGRGLNFFHPENWRRSPAIIRTALSLSGCIGGRAKTPKTSRSGTMTSRCLGCRLRSTA